MRIASCRAGYTPLSSIATSAPRPPVSSRMSEAASGPCAKVAAPRLAGQLAAALDAVDGDHQGSGLTRERRGQEADDALPEDRQGFARTGLRRQDGIQGDGADADEAAGQGIEVVGQAMAAQTLDR